MRRYNIKKIIKEVDNFEYISFDLFDTLVKRNLNHPQDLFDLVEREYNKNGNEKISNFKEQRIAAEKDAYSQLDEPSLDDIYNNLHIEDKDRIKALEIEIELKICQQNIDFYPVFEYAKKKNKKIVIISDMYLPREVVKQILKKAQINYDYFFLSSEIEMNKRKGKIYLHVLEKLNIGARQMIHIGDSKRSDYLVPRMFGIKSMLISKKIHKLNYFNDYEPKNIDENILMNYLNNNLLLNEDYYYRVGFEVLGMILYGYVRWLDKEANKSKIDEIYFLAREGKLLEGAYDIINRNDKKCKYLYVSRQSTRPSLLSHVDSLEQFFKICIVRKGATLEDFFKYAGLDIKSYDKLLSKYRLRGTDLVWGIPQMDEIFLEIKEDIQKQVFKKEKLLTAYLRQEGLANKIAISDIGWHGTMQMALNDWATQNNMNVQLIGYYVANFGNVSSDCEQYGYLYDKKTDEYKVKGFIGLFEDLFLADHGTTLEYRNEGNKIVPILAKYEFAEQEGEAFRKVQRGALDFVRRIMELDSLDLSVLPDFARVGIEKLGLEPSKLDIRMFGSMSFMDTRSIKMVKLNHSLAGYMLHLEEFKRDFLDSSWKIGWLKSLFKLSLPYTRILQFLYKRTQNDG